MKKLVLALGLAFVLCLGAQGQTEKAAPKPQAASSKSVQQRLMELDKEWAEAEAKGDTARINKILATNYMFIGLDGHTGDREEAVHMKGSGVSVTTSDHSVRVSGNTAVMTYNATFKSGDNSGQAKATQVWVKHGNSWQILSHQWTLVPVDRTRVPVLACAKSSFEPEVHSLYGDVRSILYKLDNDHMGLPQRRAYVALLESDKGAELVYFERQKDENYKVLRWTGGDAGELREKLTTMILKNRGIACVGAQSKALIQAKLNLNDLGAIPAPLNANAAFSHLIRQHDGEYLRLTVFLLC